MGYMKEQGGYIADVPNIHFKRKDGKVFYYDEVTAASFAPAMETMEINAGHSLYPLAFIPSGSSLEASFTSAEFKMNLFEMANDEASAPQANFKRWKTVLATVTDNAAIIDDVNADVTSVVISGLEKTAEAVATGKFTAAFTTPKLTLSFFAGNFANGDTVKVTYQATHAATVVDVMTDGGSARGELTMEWPVYSGNSDADVSSTKGYVIATVYSARITALPGFDSSYKTAATNSISMQALDPKRADKKMYSVAYIEA